jgi:hypothetical protein
MADYSPEKAALYRVLSQQISHDAEPFRIEVILGKRACLRDHTSRLRCLIAFLAMQGTFKAPPFGKMGFRLRGADERRLDLPMNLSRKCDLSIYDAPAEGRRGIVRRSRFNEE